MDKNATALPLRKTRHSGGWRVKLISKDKQRREPLPLNAKSRRVLLEGNRGGSILGRTWAGG
jgi:hypothetical protein